MNQHTLSLCPSRTFKNARRGFSLMEILIVLALIAAMAGLLISNYGKIFGSGNEQIAEMWVNETIKTPLMAYRIHVGSFPSTEEGLQALVKAPAGKENFWKGPYVDKLPLDPWKHPYQYRFPGKNNPDGYDVFSFGPDGQESEDDIGNWEKKSH